MKKPGWKEVKARLRSLGPEEMESLVADLYAMSADNKAFVHTRLALGGDGLAPYKETLDRWLWPDLLRRQDTSTAKAKAAVVNYRRAAGEGSGLAELTTYYCETAAGFVDDSGYADERYFDAMVWMFGQALEAAATLPPAEAAKFRKRLNRVRKLCHDFGYGLGADMDLLMGINRF